MVQSMRRASRKVSTRLRCGKIVSGGLPCGDARSGQARRGSDCLVRDLQKDARRKKGERADLGDTAGRKNGGVGDGGGCVDGSGQMRRAWWGGEQEVVGWGVERG